MSPVITMYPLDPERVEGDDPIRAEIVLSDGTVEVVESTVKRGVAVIHPVAEVVAIGEMIGADVGFALDFTDEPFPMAIVLTIEDSASGDPNYTADNGALLARDVLAQDSNSTDMLDFEAGFGLL